MMSTWIAYLIISRRLPSDVIISIRTFVGDVDVEVEAVFALVGQHKLHPFQLVIAGSGHRLQTGRPGYVRDNTKQ